MHIKCCEKPHTQTKRTVPFFFICNYVLNQKNASKENWQKNFGDTI